MECLNKIIKADHGRIKRLLNDMMGFKSFTSAYRCIRGIETALLQTENSRTKSTH